MSNSNIGTFLNQHCRFIMRSGREVFGVVWKVESDTEKYVFSSLSDHQSYLKTKDLTLVENGLQVNIDDIILAEKIAS